MTPVAEMEQAVETSCVLRDGLDSHLSLAAWARKFGGTISLRGGHLVVIGSQGEEIVVRKGQSVCWDGERFLMEGTH